MKADKEGVFRRPLIGVNYNCHNYQKCNETKDESIARAVRQVRRFSHKSKPSIYQDRLGTNTTNSPDGR